MGIEAYKNKEKEFRIIISNTYSNKIDKKKMGKEKFILMLIQKMLSIVKIRFLL